MSTQLQLPDNPKERTRAEEQAHINNLCLKGEIDMEQWRVLTDELSNPHKWTAAGRVK